MLYARNAEITMKIAIKRTAIFAKIRKENNEKSRMFFKKTE